MTVVSKRVHLVLQGKGGVGKTLAASLLAQYLTEAGGSVRCYDTDPVNSSFAAITALAAKPVDLLDGEQINSLEIDRLVNEWIGGEGDVIVDNGAAGFVPMSKYLIENEVNEVLAAHGWETVIHTVITGGGSMLDTLRGLASVIQNYPPAVKLVVWLNEYFGPLVADGIAFEDTKVYRDHLDRIAGLVRLVKVSPHHNRNILEMLDRKLTFAEAIARPDVMVIAKQRLTMVKRAVFAQISAVV
jgi:CobQ/CobB/MinD/ParA nucleotide binding domain